MVSPSEIRKYLLKKVTDEETNSWVFYWSGKKERIFAISNMFNS